LLALEPLLALLGEGLDFLALGTGLFKELFLLITA